MTQLTFEALSRGGARSNLVDTITATTGQLSLSWLVGVAIVVLCYLCSQRIPWPSTWQYWRPPLPPLAKGTPFVGDTFEYLKLGPYYAIPLHKKHGDIFRSYLLGEQVVHIGDGDYCRKLATSEHKLVEEAWPHNLAVLIGHKTLSLLHKDQHVDIVVELLLGFPKSFATPQLLARQQALFDTVHEGLAGLPFNLPGTAFRKGIKAKQEVLAMYKENVQRLQQDIDRPSEGRIVSPMELIIKGARDSQDPFYDMHFFQEMCWQLVFAGHDTSACTLSLMLHYLKKQPWVLDKLRAEQKQVQGKHGKEVTAEYLADMSYADVVIKEVMRLTAIVNMLPRRAITTFEMGGYTIPKGMRVHLELWRVLQNDPRWQAASGAKAPTVFNPDRWLDEDAKEGGNFMPFSAGPRMCPGQGFAWNEIKVMMAVLTRDYDWECDLSEPIKMFPLPAPAWALPMTFRRLE